MSIDPASIIGEVLGEPAAQMRSPVNAGYECPHINSECVKKSQGISGPYPVCSIWHWQGRARLGVPERSRLVCVCPKRFYQVPLLQDVLQHCWTWPKPSNPQIVHEITMRGFGNVDCVIADVGPGNSILQFLSVELQAIDITGSVLPAYNALIASTTLARKPSYGLNFANVYKRFVTQLIAKGYFHHHWGSKIVALVQDVVLENICNRYPFPTVDKDKANIIFMSYKYQPATPGATAYSLVFDKVMPTHHSNLQNAVLYQTPPSKEEFCRHIQGRLRGG